MTNKAFAVVSLLLIAAVVCPAGCSRTDHRIPDAAPAGPRELYQPFAAAQGLPEQLIDRQPYRLHPGDVLEVIYQVKNVTSDTPYQLKIEDIIRISFPYQERFDQELTVQADGTIRCLLVGRVRAESLSAGELEEQLRRAYGRYIREPEMTVVVEAANVKIVELKKAITTAPRGQSRLIPIKPDGTIDLPYIGEVHVSGLTVAQAKHVLDDLYVQNDLNEVEVTVQTLNFASKKIFVMGEVLTPGMIETTGNLTLAQAVTQMGGPTYRAEKSKILLVRRKWLPLPQAIVVDLNALFETQVPSEFGLVPNGGMFRHDPYLADGDIVYVPASDLAKSADWIDLVFTKGIRSVFPYSGVVGLNFGYDLHNAESAIKTRTIGPPQINSQFGP